MKLTQLETFAQVAALGSVSRAAHALGLAQSLVSRNLAQLEREWGDRLFERTGRGMALSEFGRRMLPEVAHLVGQSRRVAEAARDGAGVPSGTVCIGIVPSLATGLASRLFEDLRQSAPRITLSFMEGFSGTLDERLADGRVDMAIINRYGRTRHRNEDVLGRVETLLVRGASDERRLAGPVALRALATMPLVLPPAPNGLRSMLDQHCRKLGIELDVVVEADSLIAMKDILMSGHARTLLPYVAVSADVAAGRLLVTRLVQPSLPRTITLGTTPARPLSRSARFVLARIRRLMPQFLQPARPGHDP